MKRKSKRKLWTVPKRKSKNAAKNVPKSIAKNVAKRLSDIYYSPKHPASFSNVGKLWLAAGKKIPKKDINEWLMGQYTYTRHKPIRHVFPRNCYNLNNIDQLWESDLIIFPAHYAEHNDGVKYVLCKLLIHTCIQTFFSNIFF